MCKVNEPCLHWKFENFFTRAERESSKILRGKIQINNWICMVTKKILTYFLRFFIDSFSTFCNPLKNAMFAVVIFNNLQRNLLTLFLLLFSARLFHHTAFVSSLLFMKYFINEILFFTPNHYRRIMRGKFYSSIKILFL